MTNATDTDTDTETARVIIEVRAGIIPGNPGQADPEHTRRYGITSTQWEALDGDAQSIALAELIGRAHGYAELLMLQPDRFNWVSVDWMWM